MLSVLLCTDLLYHFSILHVVRRADDAMILDGCDDVGDQRYQDNISCPSLPASQIPSSPLPRFSDTRSVTTCENTFGTNLNLRSVPLFIQIDVNNTNNNAQSIPQMAIIPSTYLQFLTISILLASLASTCSAFQPSRISGFNNILSRRMASFSSFSDFLAQKPRFDHVVVGNPAGDADSIISSLSLAYVDHLTGEKPNKSPIVSVSRADLPLRRETVLLLGMMQVSTQALTYLDDLPSAMHDSSVTLVDHNKLLYSQLEGSKVAEILDHHMDEQAHDHVVGELRNIAFEGSSALVGSACTLIAERLLQSSPREIPSDLALGLLGVILLDTVNMSKSAAKGTLRDQAASDALMKMTDWSALSQQDSTKQFFTSQQPDTQGLYDFLNESKFDIAFWKSLSAKDALRLDYKQFTASSGDVFGAASVLLPLSDFLEKPDLEQELLEYMAACKIPILVVLSMVIADDKPTRSVLVCGPIGSTLVDSMANHLLNTESLQMTEIESASTSELTIRQFAQGNPKGSRKQIVPILMNFYDTMDRGNTCSSK